jgi:CubicO group peptidase (beta-lactamase class C family)
MFICRIEKRKTMSRLLIMLLLMPLFAQADELDVAIQKGMQEQGVPGLTFAVVRNGGIVRLGAYGFGNLEWQARATNDTRFEVASVSKMVDGAAIRILVEEGKVDPEAPVSRYVEGLPSSWSAMKVRHLITMSSGLPEDFGSAAIPYNAEVCTPADDASLIKEFTTLPMKPIGDQFSYSSANYAMLGMIVAKVSGKSYAQFLQERIFTRAGMTQSSVIDNSAVISERAEGYRRAKGELKRGWFLGQYLHSRPDDAVLTTARDLARFVVALEAKLIVKDPEKMWSFPRSDTGHFLDYAYGWHYGTWLGHRRFEHAGGYRTGFHTFVARFPDDALSVIVLTNCDFSAIRDFINMITRAYLIGASDPGIEATKTDSDPETTARLIGVMNELAKPQLNPEAIYPDAIEPIGLEETSKFLAHAALFRYAGRGRVHLTMHAHELVDYETLRTEIDARPLFLTLYRDASGKVAYIEPTN